MTTYLIDASFLVHAVSLEEAQRIAYDVAKASNIPTLRVTRTQTHSKGLLRAANSARLRDEMVVVPFHRSIGPALVRAPIPGGTSVKHFDPCNGPDAA